MPRTYWRVIDPAHRNYGVVGYHMELYGNSRYLKVPGQPRCFDARQDQLERVEPEHLRYRVTRDLLIHPDVNGRRRWVYRGTPVVEYSAADVILDSGGKRKPEVAEVIQAALNEGKIGAKLLTKRNEWRLKYRGEVIPFSDLMILKR